AYAKAQASPKPFVIIAKTVKGKGVSFLEDKDGSHGKTLKKEELEKALEELGKVDDSLRFDLKNIHPRGVHSATSGVTLDGSPEVNFKIGEQIATREVYGQVLAELGEGNELIYSLDGDTKNSTYSQDFKKAHPERFIECFIAEQNMVGVAVGLSVMGKIPFVSTFAAFLTRTFDQIRMAAISRANIKFVGSHAGVSIGEDGPSQMGLEDIALFGAIPQSIILHPADGTSTAKLLPYIANYPSIAYLRTLRPKTPVLYDEAEEFAIGGSKILRESEKDIAVVVAAGITVHEALLAHQTLEKDGLAISVIDAYSVKPIDEDTIIRKAKGSRTKTVIVVEDHYFHGGLGDMVLNAVAGQNIRVIKLAVGEISRSGTSQELLDAAGISAKHIVKKIKNLIS
ncbi:transketolase, partial [Candidatus Microgenomates bacterium]|nr:transketolase [Candidatus Microgenomates bacterium]